MVEAVVYLYLAPTLICLCTWCLMLHIDKDLCYKRDIILYCIPILNLVFVVLMAVAILINIIEYSCPFFKFDDYEE